MNKEIDNKTSHESSAPAPAAKTESSIEGAEGKKTFLGGLASIFGFGKGKTEEKPPTGDVGTSLAHERTDLALERSFLAAERTLMAWIRTSLSMISFGFTIGKLGQVLNDLEIKGPRGTIRSVSTEEVAHFLVVLGTAALLGAAIQHRHRMRALYAMGLPRKFSLTFVIALLLVALGGFALSALIMAL